MQDVVSAICSASTLMRDARRGGSSSSASRGIERRGARYSSPQGRSGMLLIICYASWRVTRATRQRAAGEIETRATGSAFEIDEKIQRGTEKETAREREKEREGSRTREILTAMRFDRSRMSNTTSSFDRGPPDARLRL